MSSFPFFQVDAFTTGEPLTGNPAAVVVLDHWLPDDLLQKIAAENNLSETAFTVPADGDGDADFDLRWFTPTVEVDLCGHATLASGHVLMAGHEVAFSTRSGLLTVRRDADSRLELDLPAPQLREGREPALCAALGVSDRPLWIAEGCNDAAIVLLDDEAAVRASAPDFAALAAVPRMAIVTAPGDQEAIVSRVFVPFFGIDEDPVTGSAHAALTRFWTGRLGRDRFTASQASRRGGRIDCRLDGDRAILGGACATVIVGHFQL